MFKSTNAADCKFAEKCGGLLRESGTFGEGTTENVIIMRSGYSSRTLLISNVPMPLPVPPPKEWHTWKPVDPLAA